MKTQKTNTKNLTKKLTESSLMVAFATVLSMLKLIEMPYGGSVTLASMLPILIVSYRFGVGTGLMSGVVYAVIQQLLGLNNLSYVTGWQSVLAVIFLDYVLAFTVIGLGGIFKNKLKVFEENHPKRQAAELATGMAFVCILRYICHTVAGATVWAGLSIPTEAALIYSISYNATYMLPETIVSVLVAFWMGTVIDFSQNVPTRFLSSAIGAIKGASYEIMMHFATLISLFTVALDTLFIAPHLQDAESGEFTLSYLTDVNWILITVFTLIGIAASVILIVIAKRGQKRPKD